MAKRSKKKKVTNASFDYKERVVEALAEQQVPVRIAEIAVIDLRTEINIGFHNKWTARETAASMLKKVDKIYKTEDKWHYGYSPRSIAVNAVSSNLMNVGSIPTGGANGSSSV